MKFSIPIKKLKSMGFEYNCKNYKSYYKQYGSISLHLIVSGREIWVTDWGRYTKEVIDFVRSNYDKWLKWMLTGQVSEKDAYMPLLLNDETGEMIVETSDIHIDKYHNSYKYKNYRSILIMRGDFDEFFNDIKQIV